MARTGSPATASASRCRKSGSGFSRTSARPGSCRAWRARPAPIARSPASGSRPPMRRRLAIATHRVPSARLPDLLDGLCAVGAGRCAAGRVRGAGHAGPLQIAPRRPSTGCSRLTGSRTSCRRWIPPVLAGGSGWRVRAPRGSHDPHKIAHQPQDRPGADAARQKPRFRGLPADRIPHCVARRDRA